MLINIKLTISGNGHMYHIELLDNIEQISEELDKYLCPTRLISYIDRQVALGHIRELIGLAEDDAEIATDKKVEKLIDVSQRNRYYHTPDTIYSDIVYKNAQKYSNSIQEFINMTKHLMDDYGNFYDTPKKYLYEEPPSYYERIGYDWKMNNIPRDKDGNYIHESESEFETKDTLIFIMSEQEALDENGISSEDYQKMLHGEIDGKLNIISKIYPKQEITKKLYLTLKFKADCSVGLEE